MNYDLLIKNSIKQKNISKSQFKNIILDPSTNLLLLLDAAYQVRQKYWGTEVLIHILNNVRNGYCNQDCKYCAQSKISKAKIHKYLMKSVDEIMREAENAYKSKAFRYCLALSGPKLSKKELKDFSKIIIKIKKTYPIQVCLSAGTIDQASAQLLKSVGLDRYNHNINTSECNYSNICTTHSFQDRIATLQALKKVGLQICSGLIVGLGESLDDLYDMAQYLNQFQVESIPINFYIPISGNSIKQKYKLTPHLCLKILCMFRFMNPKSEIRVAAGREMHLRYLQALAFYPANSIFMDGYLNIEGQNQAETIQMINDAGFQIKSNCS